MNSAGSCVLTLFSKQYSIATPCQVFFLTLFSKQFSIAMPYKVICLSFERLHLEWCRLSCVDIVFDAILQIHAMPGDLFFE